jgi:hypothetical protein
MDSRFTAINYTRPCEKSCDKNYVIAYGCQQEGGRAVGQECISTAYDLCVSLQASIGIQQAGIQQASSQMASNSQAAWGIAMDPALFWNGHSQ